jgi:hypothetical protein
MHAASLFDRIRKQADRRQADEEAIRRLAAAHPKRDAQRLPVGIAQAVEPIEHRRAALT